MADPNHRSREPLILLIVCAIALAASAIRPYTVTNWILETFPIFLAAPILVLTARRFPLTPLTYRLIFLHALILIYGAYYSYALTPLGDWARDLIGGERNNYDRLGHFMQGSIPAIIAREIYLRRLPPLTRGWLFFLVVCTCMAISVAYEFTEWWAAIIGGDAANAFLGAQGDEWDTQWDMFLATVGSAAAQLLLNRVHDRQLASMASRVSGKTTNPKA